MGPEIIGFRHWFGRAVDNVLLVKFLTAIPAGVNFYARS